MKSKFLAGSSMRAPGASAAPVLRQTIGDMIGEPTPHWSEGQEFQNASDHAAALLAKAGRHLRKI